MRAVAPAILIIWRARWLPEGSRRSRLICVASEAVAVLSTARPCTIWPVTSLASLRRAIGCGPAHLVGHAFGNRIARCLAVDQPSLVRSVTLLAAGGLIVPSTPIGTHFRNATQAKMNGSDCVTVLGARWLSPASDPKVLKQVECWPAVHIAHLATSRNVPLEYWWSAGTAPLLVIQGLDDEAAPPGNGYALREQLGERVRVVDLPDAGHFLLLEQPEAVARAVSQFLGADNAPG